MSTLMEAMAELRLRRSIEASEAERVRAQQGKGVHVVDAKARLGQVDEQTAKARTGEEIRLANRATRDAIEANTWGVVGRAKGPAMHVTKPGSGWSVRQTRVHFSHG